MTNPDWRTLPRKRKEKPPGEKLGRLVVLITQAQRDWLGARASAKIRALIEREMGA